MKVLLLEGGGAKGAYQAGAIKAFRKKGYDFDAIGGTSIGAINAAFYVCHNLDAMYKLWTDTSCEYLFGIDEKVLSNLHDGDITIKDLKNGFDEAIKIVKNKGVDTSNIKKLLQKNIKEDRFFNSKIDFGMNTYNLSDRKPVSIFKKDIQKGKLIETLLASAYLPFFKFEKIIDNKYYVDGGVHNNCPIDMFIENGYKDIYVVRNWQNKLKYTPKRGVKVHIITPRENLGSIVLFSKETSEYRMKLGYYDTLKFLDQLDGNKYYFKYYNKDYYDSLFDKVSFNRIVKEYNSGIKPKSNKEFILKNIEIVCNNLKINRFNIYNMPILISKLKYKMAGKKKDKYYNFIKEIKVNFE